MSWNQLSHRPGEEASFSDSVLVGLLAPIDIFRAIGVWQEMLIEINYFFMYLSKPYTALAGFGDKIVVPKEVQE